jgi:hypothetical protein
MSVISVSMSPVSLHPSSTLITSCFLLIGGYNAVIQLPTTQEQGGLLPDHRFRLEREYPRWGRRGMVGDTGLPILLCHLSGTC